MAVYLLDITRWYEVYNNRKGTAKATKKWIYVCPQKKLVRRIQYVGVYLPTKGYQCNAKVKLSPLDEFLDEIHEHTHVPSQTECQVTKVKSGIKRQAEETEETTQQILGTELQNISDGVGANLPSLETLRRNIRHSCQDRNMPPTPSHREDIPDLPPAYRTTTNGDPFLVYDSGVEDEERILIFTSQDAMQFLSDSEHWCVDGTFRVCPENSFQLHTIHGRRDGRIFLYVF